MQTVLGCTEEAYEQETRRRWRKLLLTGAGMLVLQLLLLFISGRKLLTAFKILDCLMGILYFFYGFYLRAMVLSPRKKLLDEFSSGTEEYYDGTLTLQGEALCQHRDIWCRKLKLQTAEGEKQLYLPAAGALAVTDGEQGHFLVKRSFLLGKEAADEKTV